MNLNQLEYFVAVAETLNFTRAAEKCFISQTAMTQQIRALEKKVGVPLFIRDKHHVELTAAGSVYLKEVRKILYRSNEALKMARLASEGVEGEITIGFVKGYGHSDFVEILNAFHKTYPNIKIHLLRDNMGPLLNHLERKRCDVVFAGSISRMPHAGLSILYRKSYQVMAVLSPEHPLADSNQLRYEQLKDETFIMMQPSDRPKDQMEESMLIYERGGYLPNIEYMESDQETLLLMVSAGMGISLIPEYITKQYRYSKNLKIIPMIRQDGTAETIDMEICWREDNTNPALGHLLELVQGQELEET